MHAFPRLPVQRLTAAALCVVAIACGSTDFSIDHPGGEDPDSGNPAGGDDSGGGPIGSDASPAGDASPPADARADVTPSDGGADAPSDAPPDAPPCTPTPLAAGVLMIEEIMIAGGPSTDLKEWVEVRNTSTCQVNLKGLHALSPRGASPDDTLDVTTDTYVPAGGSFLIVDSTVSTENGGLPGMILPWTINSTPVGDVLKNSGDSVELRIGSAAGTLIDAVTYGSLSNLTNGTSFEFSSTCLPTSKHTDFVNWNPSVHPWNGFFATPNAVNDDVSGC